MTTATEPRAEAAAPPFSLSDQLCQALDLHYGRGPKFRCTPSDAIDFPARCSTALIEHFQGTPRRALVLGCSAGRSAFELARVCEEVVAIDSDQDAIAAAEALKQAGKLEYRLTSPVGAPEKHTALVPSDIHRSRVEFQCSNPAGYGQRETYDLLLCSGLLCQLAEPKAFLEQLPRWLNKCGVALVATPYDWNEARTPQKQWIDRVELNAIMSPHCDLMEERDMPYLLRTHARCYQWTVASASFWRKK